MPKDFLPGPKKNILKFRLKENAVFFCGCLFAKGQ